MSGTGWILCGIWFNCQNKNQRKLKLWGCSIRDRRDHEMWNFLLLKICFFHFVFMEFWRKRNWRESERFTSRNSIRWHTRVCLSYRGAMALQFHQNFARIHSRNNILAAHNRTRHFFTHTAIGEIFSSSRIFSHIFGIYGMLEPVAAVRQMGGVNWLIAKETRAIPELRRWIGNWEIND